MKDSHLSKKTKKHNKKETSSLDFRHKDLNNRSSMFSHSLFFNLIFLIPVLLFFILFIVLLINKNIQEENKKIFLLNSPFYFSSAIFYPLVSDINFSLLPISAPGIVIMDNDTKTLLFGQNENSVFSTASTAKIMTAIVALDYYKLDDILAIKTAKTEGAVVGFKEGEQLFFQDILYGMLLPSGNDAAIAIAQNYPGGEKEFVKKMNEKAVKLHLNNTHFTDSSGLDDDGDVTTPLELAHLSSYALRNNVFAKIVSTKQKTITTLSGNSYNLQNLNKLLGVAGINGVKTGSTPKAGEILVTSKMENGHMIITVVMKSADRFADTQGLTSLLSGHVTYLTIHP